jgi:hypothetical protein
VKICKTCNQEKPDEAFQQRTDRQSRRSKCIECSNRFQKDWIAKKRAKQRKQNGLPPL